MVMEYSTGSLACRPQSSQKRKAVRLGQKAEAPRPRVLKATSFVLVYIDVYMFIVCLRSLGSLCLSLFFPKKHSPQVPKGLFTWYVSFWTLLDPYFAPIESADPGHAKRSR